MMSLHLVVHQEKHIFGGIFKKPQKTTQEESSDDEVKRRTLLFGFLNKPGTLYNTTQSKVIYKPLGL